MFAVTNNIRKFPFVLVTCNAILYAILYVIVYAICYMQCNVFFWLLLYVKLNRLGNFCVAVSLLKFEGCKSLGKKAHFVSHPGFEIQTDYDFETSEFKPH